MATEITKDEAERIFNEYSPYVYRTALLLTKSEALADDITQETFIKAFEKYHLFDPTRPIKPWIYKITVNTFRNMYRKQKWLKFIGVIPDISTIENTVETTILRGEQNREIYNEVANLPAKSREVIVLYYFAELKISEVSLILDIPIGTCKSRINRAIKQLRCQLPENKLNLKRGGEIHGEI
ncbi:RNA polymerase sigma factor [Sporosarcina cyprini]|uniref:RNA polymerase sigma factor n=1 Tax=Sporosarcina cyprini TaxID=2910523 RepID=UPI001EDF6D5D|nr:RNA polymerase sigma factor [Sporosarcina cyprini]MCG3088501.1 RNA polymerase sigma factor [Sporosarcina cyprini]